jgi:hypothetical protein
MRLPAPLNPKKIQPGWLIKLQNKSFDFSLGMCEVDQKSYLKTGGLQIVEKLGLVNFFKRSVY